MRKVLGLYHTSIGKKVLMATTGIVLAGFVLVHMIGNLKIYQGAVKYDAYAVGLREFGAPFLGHGQFLWIARIVLLACVGIHIVAAIQLTRMSWAARPVGYRKGNSLEFSYASRTMRWGGLIVGLFVVYHLLHLTTGTLHPEFEHGAVYANVVAGFSVWWVSAIYVAAMIALGFHLYHGLWSMTQTLAIENPRVKRWRRPVSAAFALVVVVGNISIPVAVLTGVVG